MLENTVTTSSTMDKGTLDIGALQDAIKILQKEIPFIVEARFRKIPDEIRQIKIAKEGGAGAIWGIPLLIDKSVPIDECWMKDNKGNVEKIKI